VIEDFAHRLLTGAIVFTERDAAETMVPRPDVVAVSAAATARDVERMMVESGHSRIVVHRGDLDDVVGFVHIKDLLDIDDDAADRPLDPAVIRPMPVVPESAPVQGVLVEMQRTRSHIALVVDEHGSSAGIITLEDIAEELVGDIRDEHDPRSSEIRKVAGGFVVAGGVRPDHLRELGVAIPAGEYDTVGGFLMNRLGRVPDVGDEVDEAGATLRVRRMAGRRIAEIEVTPAPPEPGAEGEDE
jgi:putative hemolysin